MELQLDFDALTVGEIDLIEDTLNEQLRPMLGDKIVTFADVAANFDPDQTPEIKIPQGKLMRAMGLVQLRRTDPEATWADTFDLTVSVPEMDPTPAPGES